MTDKITPAIILFFSVLAVGYFLFQAPLWCGSVTRDQTLCRNNSSGLLIGCHLRQHKWQKLRMTVVPNMWRELNRGLWVSPKQILATLAALTGITSALVAMVGTLGS